RRGVTPPPAPAPPGRASGCRRGQAHQTVRLPQGAAIDPGGIGKGLAADIVAEEMLEAGAGGVCVNVGGDLRVAGCPPTPAGWTVGVDDPFGGPPLTTLALQDGAIATSSRLGRTWNALRGAPPSPPGAGDRHAGQHAPGC